MMVAAGSVALLHSPVRARIYEHLLLDPSRPWAVKDLHKALADNEISVHSVRAVLYVLLGERVVEEQRGQRAMTVRLTERGREIVSVILDSWARQEAKP